MAAGAAVSHPSLAWLALGALCGGLNAIVFLCGCSSADPPAVPNHWSPWGGSVNGVLGTVSGEALTLADVALPGAGSPVTFEVVATDGVGNAASQTVSLYVARAPLTVALQQPPRGGAVRNLRWYLVGLEYADDALLQRDLQNLKMRFLRLCDPGSRVAATLGEQATAGLRTILERDFDLIVHVGMP